MRERTRVKQQMKEIGMQIGIKCNSDAYTFMSVLEVLGLATSSDMRKLDCSVKLNGKRYG